LGRQRDLPGCAARWRQRVAGGLVPPEVRGVTQPAAVHVAAQIVRIRAATGLPELEPATVHIRRVGARLSRGQDSVGSIKVPGYRPVDSRPGCIFIHRRLRQELTILPRTECPSYARSAKRASAAATSCPGVHLDRAPLDPGERVLVEAVEQNRATAEQSDFRFTTLAVHAEDETGSMPGASNGPRNMPVTPCAANAERLMSHQRPFRR
jgi:hypothetical protein